MADQNKVRKKDSDLKAIFDCLPIETLETIWLQDSLSFEDICALSRVCKLFRDVSFSSAVWRKKFVDRWGQEIVRSHNVADINWRNEFIIGLEISSTIQQRIAEMSSMYYYKEELSKDNMRPFCDNWRDHELAKWFTLHTLRKILMDDDRHTNLTCKYYAEKVYLFCNQLVVTEEWDKFRDSPEQLLETGAILISQWFAVEECVNGLELRRMLDNLTMSVRKALQEAGMCHIIRDLDASPSDSMLRESLWSPAECSVILEILNKVFFTSLQYRGNTEDFYAFNNSLIDKVLRHRTGHAIILCIIYQAVARRLGVVCEPVNFPNRFLLKWKQHPELSDEESYTYIDVFGGGRLCSQNDCWRMLGELTPFPDNDSSHFQTASSLQVLQRVVRNIIVSCRQGDEHGHVDIQALRHAMELYLLMSPHDAEVSLCLAKIYIRHRINLGEVVDMLQHLEPVQHVPMGMVSYLTLQAEEFMRLEPAGAPELVAKRRAEEKHREVTFSVGLIMRHKRYDYMCVVYGWDPKCLASRDWILQMGVHHLPKKDAQPFYNVLVEDGSNRYAAQENLVPSTTPVPITHCEVGRFFQAFNSRYYVMNQERAAEYPDDQAVTNGLAGSAQ